MRDNLRRARQEKGMTQKQVAEYLDKVHTKYKIVHDGAFVVCEDGIIFKKYKNGLYRCVPPKPLGREYQVISECKNGKTQCFLAHRIIAQAFLPNPLNYPQVNHIDGNKANNCVSNLEWCDAGYNVRDSIKRHSPKYLTQLKKIRLANGMSQSQVACSLHITLGAYRDIEHAVTHPIPFLSNKIEAMFGENIEFLLSEVLEDSL